MRNQHVHHTIIHQYDPEHHVAGGTPGFIRDLLQHGGAERRFTIIGVTQSSTRQLGKQVSVELAGGGGVAFVPVARVLDATHKRRIPHTAQLVGGLFRFRPRIGAGVVHFHRAETAVAYAKHLSNVRVVTFLHGAGQAHKFGAGGESFWRVAPSGFYDGVMRMAIRHSDCAYVMDRGKAEALEGAVACDVRVGRNWFDGSLFHPPTGKRTRCKDVVAWVGRLEESKDPLLAVAMFRELAARGHAFEAWMAGNGPLREEVERELSASGLDMVQVVGLLKPHELAERLRNSTICVATSRWEGIPRAVIEALACGVPVVSTDVGDVRSLIAPEGGALVADRTPSSLVDAVELVLANANPSAVAESVAHLDVKRVVPSLLHDIEVQPSHA